MNKADVKVGMRVEFGSHGSKHGISRGNVTKINPKRAKVFVDEGITKGQWTVPYALLRPNGVSPSPFKPLPTKKDTNFKIGDQVMFGRKNGMKLVGIVTKFNPKSVIIETKTGKKYRVGYSLIKPFKGDNLWDKQEEVVNNNSTDLNAYTYTIRGGDGSVSQIIVQGGMRDAVAKIEDEMNLEIELIKFQKKLN